MVIKYSMIIQIIAIIIVVNITCSMCIGLSSTLQSHNVQQLPTLESFAVLQNDISIHTVDVVYSLARCRLLFVHFLLPPLNRKLYFFSVLCCWLWGLLCSVQQKCDYVISNRNTKLANSNGMHTYTQFSQLGRIHFKGLCKQTTKVHNRPVVTNGQQCSVKCAQIFG